MQPGRFQSSHLFQNAPEIEVRQSVFWIRLQSALKVFGRLFEVAFFVEERPTVEQCVELLRINAQSVIIRVHRFGWCFTACAIPERGGETFVGIRPWLSNDAHSFA